MAEEERPLRVFAVSPATPFLPAFIDAFLEGRLVPGLRGDGDPLAVCNVRVLLPSRRALRSAEAAMLAGLGRRAALLPRFQILPEVDEAELLFEDPAETGFAASAAAIAPALSALDRSFALYRSVERLVAKQRAAQGDDVMFRALPAEVAHLAGALGRLFDAVAAEEGDLGRLDQVLPEGFDLYWQASAAFLEIVRTLWPEELKARGAVDPGERWRRLLAMETERIAIGGGGPVVAVAPPAATPQVRRLLSAIARRPDGAVVLPGLDLALDEPSWTLVSGDGRSIGPSPGHPQHGLAQILESLGIARSAVEPLEARGGASKGRACRERLLSEALRPAESTHLWGELGSRLDSESIDAALASVVVIEAQNEREEALAIALALREVAATPGRTAALVTPDRVIARRVSAELSRFGISIDDSAGVPLSRTPPAVFGTLIIEAAAEGFSPVSLLALLKHPFASFGLTRADTRTATRVLERAVLRGPRPKGGLAGLAAALREQASNRRALSAWERTLALGLVEALTGAFAPLQALAAGDPRPFREVLGAHLAALEKAARTPGGEERLLAGESGRVFAEFLSDLMTCGHEGVSLRLGDYSAFLTSLMADRVVRPAAPSHPRLHIWGLREGRLQHVHRMVLAGLNEGSWPPEPDPDPWLNRAMRAAIGLPPVERLAGLSAHSFAGAFASDEVFLVRSLRSGGAPTVPSRLLSRIEAVIGPERISGLVAAGRRYLAWAATMDAPPAVRAVERPCPRPPVAARPTRLSIADIETLLQDPYSIYARHVLRLAPLDGLDVLPSAAERGMIVHQAVLAFARAWSDNRNSSEALIDLLNAARLQFEPFLDHPPVAALWWPRFEAAARWFLEFEFGRRQGAVEVLSEHSGRLLIEGPAAPFELEGHADRIERLADGSLAIFDYRTGRPPTAKQIRLGLAPRLPLLAAVARAGGFGEDYRNRSVAELAYIVLSGGDPAGHVAALEAEEPSRCPDQAADEALGAMKRLVRRLQDRNVGFPSVPRTRFGLRQGPYDHLARLREWGLADDGAGP